MPGSRNILSVSLLSCITAFAQQAAPPPAPAPTPAPLPKLSTTVAVVDSLKEYHLDETSLATKTPVKLLDLPQSVQVYPNQLIEDRAILEGNELFRNVSGLNQSTYSAMVFRGFTQREILYNGARGNPFGSLDGDINNAGFSTSQIRLTNIQRVEVLKGPTSALYGAGEPGGLINYVTKQPKEVLDGELHVRFGSFGQKYASGDFSGPLGKRLLARGAFYFEDRDSFRVNSGARNSDGVLNLTYKVNDRHRFSGEAEYLDQTLDGQRTRGIPVTAAGSFLTYIQWSANEPTDKIRMLGRVLQLRGEHNFASGWDVGYTFRYLEYENNDKYHEPRGLNAATAAGQTMRREYRNFFRSNDDWSIMANASRQVKTGSVTHKVVVGAERFDQDHAFRSARARETEVAGGQVPALDLFQPVYRAVDPAAYRLSAFPVATGQTSRTGVYGQDQIILNRYVQALISGRVDRYNDKGFSGVALRYQDTALSGRAALVVKPVEHISLYGNFATSATRAPLFSQAPSANGPFQPEAGWQGETGVKSEWLSRRIFLTGAFAGGRPGAKSRRGTEPGRVSDLALVDHGELRFCEHRNNEGQCCGSGGQAPCKRAPAYRGSV